MVCHLEMSKAGHVDCRNLYYRSMVCFINPLIFEHVAYSPHTNTKPPNSFYAVRGYFLCLFVAKGWSFWRPPESAKEQLVPAEDADRLNPLSTVTKLVKVEGERTVEREMFVYNLRGVMEICRCWARWSIWPLRSLLVTLFSIIISYRQTDGSSHLQ